MFISKDSHKVKNISKAEFMLHIVICICSIIAVSVVAVIFGILTAFIIVSAAGTDFWFFTLLAIAFSAVTIAMTVSIILSIFNLIKAILSYLK